MSKNVATQDYSLCSLNQLSKLTGSSYRTVKYKLEKSDVKPVKSKGRAMLFDPPTALNAIYTDVEAMGGTKYNLDNERAKLIRQQRKKVKVERLRLVKTLVDAKLIATSLKNMVFGFREKMLSIPTDLANTVLSCSTKPEVEKLIRTKIETALLELATDEDFLDSLVDDE